MSIQRVDRTKPAFWALLARVVRYMTVSAADLFGLTSLYHRCSRLYFSVI